MCVPLWQTYTWLSVRMLYHCLLLHKKPDSVLHRSALRLINWTLNCKACCTITWIANSISETPIILHQFFKEKDQNGFIKPSILLEDAACFDRNCFRWTGRLPRYSRGDLSSDSSGFCPLCYEASSFASWFLPTCLIYFGGKIALHPRSKPVLSRHYSLWYLWSVVRQNLLAESTSLLTISEKTSCYLRRYRPYKPCWSWWGFYTSLVSWWNAT